MVMMAGPVTDLRPHPSIALPCGKSEVYCGTLFITTATSDIPRTCIFGHFTRPGIAVD